MRQAREEGALQDLALKRRGPVLLLDVLGLYVLGLYVLGLYVLGLKVGRATLGRAWVWTEPDLMVDEVLDGDRLTAVVPHPDVVVVGFLKL